MDLAANHGRYKPFSIGCMKRHHNVILGSIWERDSIIILFPAQRTGLLTLLLTYFTLLSFSLFTWTNFFKSNSLSSFCIIGQKFSKSNSSPLFSSDKNILSPTSILQKYSKTVPNFVSAVKSLQFYKNILSPIFFLTEKNFHFLPMISLLLPPECKRCPLKLASALACADSVDEPRF